MNNLYSSLADVYEVMYKSFINYEDEFNLYSNLLLKYKCHSVAEIGCGTGNLASRFANEGFAYTGLDFSNDMFSIAKRNNPDCRFIQADMRDFLLPGQPESIIMTGRTISYLITNKDVSNTFSAIYENLHAPGILCFDFINANEFILQITKDSIRHEAAAGNKRFKRDSLWSVNLAQCWTFDWLSVFYEEKNDGSLEKIGEDKSTIRPFTKEDIILFLQLAGFEVKDLIPIKTYAFDTFLVVAQKTSKP